jgi:predicted patatin/cPLA2 family phospholipase
MHRMVPAPTPVESGLRPVELVDPVGEASADQAWTMEDLFILGERIRQSNKPAQLPPKRSILVLSGGGAYGAYSAGVLVGWTQSGTRPMFDVVTGISTGALIAPLAFLGSDYDAQLREVYTTLRSTDVFLIRKRIRTLFREGLADNGPLANQIEKMVTPELLTRIAAEHAKGRRLYVGTTDLESRRAVQWDMGEIATRGTAADLELFRKLLLASSAIPGFFPPVRIPVTVDGKPFTERHIDGGVTNALFFRPPYIPDDWKKHPGIASLYGSDVYIIVAGKLYADPQTVSPRALTIAANSVSTLIYSQTRGDLLKLYMACILTGMNYAMTAIPSDFAAPTASTDFDPVEMTKMFNEGATRAMNGTAWRNTPPGLERGEGTMMRSGTKLTRIDLGSPNAAPRPSGIIPWLNAILEPAPTETMPAPIVPASGTAPSPR